MKHSLALLSGSVAIALVGCVAPEPPETLYPGRNVLAPEAIHAALAGRVDFRQHVKPVLAAKCVICHDSQAQPQGIHLDSYAAACRSGVFAGFIVPGRTERSGLAAKISAAHANVKAMPPVGEQLTKDEVAILSRWIQQGADWPADQ